jgi:hypothetical protein
VTSPDAVGIFGEEPLKEGARFRDLPVFPVDYAEEIKAIIGKHRIALACALQKKPRFVMLLGLICEIPPTKQLAPAPLPFLLPAPTEARGPSV